MRVFLLLAAASSVAALSAQDFVKDIQPIFRKKCVGCHGAAQQVNGLRLDDGVAALKGGYSGPAIVRGKSAESKLIERMVRRGSRAELSCESDGYNCRIRRFG